MPGRDDLDCTDDGDSRDGDGKVSAVLAVLFSWNRVNRLVQVEDTAVDQLKATTGWNATEIKARARFIKQYSKETGVEEYNDISFSIRCKKRGSKKKVAMCMGCLKDFDKHDRNAIKKHAESSCPARASADRPKKRTKRKTTDSEAETKTIDVVGDHSLPSTAAVAAQPVVSPDDADVAMTPEPQTTSDSVVEPGPAANESG